MVISKITGMSNITYCLHRKMAEIKT